MLLLHKSQYLNKDTKERKKVSLKWNENLLKYSICFYDGKNPKIKKDGCNKLEAIKVGNLGANSQLWYRK